jgi:hypothetical protein
MAEGKNLKRERPKAKVGSPVVALIVRRGARRRFRKLKEKTTNLPVKVEWDRREGERRTAASGKADRNRRKGDRRQPPPFTWDAGDFVVVERTDQRCRRSGKKKRSKQT